MRIGLTPGGDLASRVSRVLLADLRLTELGVPQPSLDEPRTVALADVEADVVVATDLEHAYVDEARRSEIPIISVEDANSTLRGDLASIAHALESQLDSAEKAFVAWTTSEDGAGDGVRVDFPAPLGRQLGYETDRGTAVPVSGPWAGILVKTEANGASRSVSVVDDLAFLQAVALAARAMAVYEGEMHPGPGYLRELANAGLEFAVTTSTR